MLTLRRARSNVRLGRVPLPRRYATYRVITSSSPYRQTIHQHQQVSRLLTHSAVYPRYRSVGGGSSAASSARPPQSALLAPISGGKTRDLALGPYTPPARCPCFGAHIPAPRCGKARPSAQSGIRSRTPGIAARTHAHSRSQVRAAIRRFKMACVHQRDKAVNLIYSGDEACTLSLRKIPFCYPRRAKAVAVSYPETADAL
jgi:hypothetical protein